MATETEAIEQEYAQDYSTVEQPRRAPLPVDARVTPGCMIWSTFLVLGSFILAILWWAATQLGEVFKNVTLNFNF